MASHINVSVIYANGQKQMEIPVTVEVDCKVLSAIEQSGILKELSEIDLKINKLGIFGRLVTIHDGLNPGDRIEIYRSLKIDPKQARIKRCQTTKENGNG